MKEFASPYEEYKQARSDSKQALLRRQIAEEGPVAASRAAEKLARLKLDDESHSRLGRAIGAGLGVAPGFALGRGNASSIAWGALTGLAGAGIGQAIGGSIRKKQRQDLSANLKPALRELSDRSEGLVEFARGDFLRQAVSKYSDVAPAGVPGVSPSVVGPRGKEWRSQFLLWARKRAAKQMV